MKGPSFEQEASEIFFYFLARAQCPEQMKKANASGCKRSGILHSEVDGVSSYGLMAGTRTNRLRWF